MSVKMTSEESGSMAKVKIRVGQMKMEAQGSEECVHKEVEAFVQFIKDRPVAVNPISVSSMDMIQDFDNTFNGEPSVTIDSRVGEVFPFDLEKGKSGNGLILSIKDNVATCIYYDCLTDARQMNEKSTNEGGYEKSDLRKQLNGKILDNVPGYSAMRMVPFENGDCLTLPSEKEIFGENKYGEEEPEEVRQFEPMKLKRNRIAFIGKADAWEWYWLRNKTDKSFPSKGFAICHSNGTAHYNMADSVLGVRPLFKIRVS